MVRVYLLSVGANFHFRNFHAGGTFNSAKEITKRLKEMKETGGKWERKVKKDKRDAEYGKVGAQGWLLG